MQHCDKGNETNVIVHSQIYHYSKTEFESQHLNHDSISQKYQSYKVVSQAQIYLLLWMFLHCNKLMSRRYSIFRAHGKEVKYKPLSTENGTNYGEPVAVATIIFEDIAFFGASGSFPTAAFVMAENTARNQHWNHCRKERLVCL